MALSVKVGQWTGNGTTSQSITGVGFQPKAIIAWVTRQTSNDSFGASIFYSIGIGTRSGGTTQSRSCYFENNDNLATTNVIFSWALNLLWAGDSASQTTLASFDADGFSVTYAANSSYLFGYMAIGGADLTNAIVVEDDWPTTGATFDVIGAGFTPDAAFYLTGSRTATAEFGTAVTEGIGVGCFAGSAQWSLSASATDADTMTSSMNWTSVFSQDACLTQLGNNSDTVDAKGIFSAFTSDGATITNTNAPANALRVFALYLQGGQWKAGSKAKASTATADSFTFNTPTFTPTGVLLGQAVGTASNTVITGTSEFTVGGASATDGTAEGYGGGTSIEAINTQADEIISNTKAIAELTPGATPAVDAAGDMTAFGSGSFTLTWDATGTAALVGFLAMGDTAVVTDQEPALIGGKLVRNSLLLRHMVH